jgi:hypothetical protein
LAVGAHLNDATILLKHGTIFDHLDAGVIEGFAYYVFSTDQG